MKTFNKNSEVFEHSYKLIDWKEEDLVNPGDGTKITEVRARFSLEGALVAETEAFFVMAYLDQIGEYGGYERVVGKFQDKPCSIVLEHSGTFDPKGVNVQVQSLKASGTEAFDGVSLSYETRFEGHGPYALSVSIKNS